MKLIGILFLVIVAFLIFGRKPDTVTSRVSSPDYIAAPREDYSPKLEVQSWRCTKEYSYVFVVGEVKNVSSMPLENVLAVGEFRTSSGQFVKSEDALLDYNPILAGQTSPFKAGGTDNPEIKKCNLSFRYLFGGEVAYTTKGTVSDRERARIKTVQQRLTALGYDIGGVDGKLGPMTTAAIREFQKAKGMTVDGTVTDSLLTAVMTAVK